MKSYQVTLIDADVEFVYYVFATSPEMAEDAAIRIHDESVGEVNIETVLVIDMASGYM